jgi:hypothetical protein
VPTEKTTQLGRGENIRWRDQHVLAGRWTCGRRFDRDIHVRARTMLSVVAVLFVFRGSDDGVNSFPLRCRKGGDSAIIMIQIPNYQVQKCVFALPRISQLPVFVVQEVGFLVVVASGFGPLQGDIKLLWAKAHERQYSEYTKYFVHRDRWSLTARLAACCQDSGCVQSCRSAALSPPLRSQHLPLPRRGPDPRILAMADPLSTIANVLTILKLAASATQYIKEVKHASSDRLRLRDELRSTTCLLEMLKDRLENSEYVADSGAGTLKPHSIALLEGGDGPLELFRQVLEEIINKLVPQTRLSRLAQSFTWPFDKKEVAELVSTLERLKSHFNLVMQNDLV